MNKRLFFLIVFLLSTNFAQAQLFKRFNLFGVEEDIRLGKQLQEEIAKDSKTYPLLDEKKYPEAYKYLRGLTADILNSGEIQYRDKFAWEVYIIENDSVLNAFVTPGGYIYVYTGLIHYLDTEDQLAGVLGHEIAHADRRHSTRNMTKQHGVSMLLNVLLGKDPGQMQQVLAGLTGNLSSLKFSRSTESEADAYSVKYLSKTKYQCNGAAGFFEKMLQEGSGQAPPEFLSTHPSSDRRVKDINNKAKATGCSIAPSRANYQRFKNLLPKSSR